MHHFDEVLSCLFVCFIMIDCCGVVVKLLQDCCENAVGLLWDFCGIAVELLRYCCGITLFWDSCGMAVGTVVVLLCVCVFFCHGITVVLLWHCRGIVVGLP